LWGLVNYGTPADYAYDVITGVSAGSINTAALAGWKVGDELNSMQWLSDMWKNLHTSDVWQDWRFGKVQGMIQKNGAVDNSPLLTFLRNTIATMEGYQRRVTLATVNVNDGTYTQFDQKNIAFEELADAAVASASIPFVFPPHIWEGKGIFMDGGTVYNINIEGAIQQCLEEVDDESKIIMDILICGAPDHPE